MSKSLRQALCATAIHRAHSAACVFTAMAGAVRRVTLPSVAVLALALSSCTHRENATSTSTETSAPAQGTGLIGTWTIPNAKPYGRYVAALSGVSFKPDHTGTWTSVSYGADRRAHEHAEPSTWTELDGNKLRIIVGSSANEVTYAFDNGKLVLTPPNVGGAGYVFERVKLSGGIDPLPTAH